jgi:CDP-6-deoxy-D-xylo-4-hexulose-3-dehydrase
VDIDVPAFAIPIVCKNTDTKNYCTHLFSEAGIETRPIVSGNMSRQPFMAEYSEHMPNADLIHEAGFYLPNHADLSTDDIERILGVISRIK